MNPALDATVFGVSMVFMLVGLVGLIVPLFPGLLVMWLTALIYGFVTGWTTLGIIIIVVITLLTIFGSLIDNILLGAGALKSGGTWWTILLAMAAGLIFTFLWPPIGGIIGTPATLLLLEYLRLKDWKKALESAKGAAIGWAASLVARFGVGIAIILLWAAWAIFRS
jgi:uncharacterized protein YqgC (DUF456 family)